MSLHAKGLTTGEFRSFGADLRRQRFTRTDTLAAAECSVWSLLCDVGNWVDDNWDAIGAGVAIVGFGLCVLLQVAFVLRLQVSGWPVAYSAKVGMPIEIRWNGVKLTGRGWPLKEG